MPCPDGMEQVAVIISDGDCSCKDVETDSNTTMSKASADLLRTITLTLISALVIRILIK